MVESRLVRIVDQIWKLKCVRKQPMGMYFFYLCFWIWPRYLSEFWKVCAPWSQMLGSCLLLPLEQSASCLRTWSRQRGGNAATPLPVIQYRVPDLPYAGFSRVSVELRVRFLNYCVAALLSLPHPYLYPSPMKWTRQRGLPSGNVLLKG